MSLILEALRKSEAERRRGQSPNLHAELPPVARTQRQPMPIWLWLMIGATALAIALWLVNSVRQAPSPATTASTESDIASVDVAPVVVPDAEPLRPNPRPGEAPVRTVEPARDPAPTTTAAAPIVAAPPPPVLVAEPDTVAAGQSPVAAPAPPPVPVPPPPVSVVNDNGLMRLADLSSEQRKQLPSLKLSMHMWHDTPARRFVIIDGNRYVEGDRVGDAVLESIVSDGVVLDWNGRRLKLPIR